LVDVVPQPVDDYGRYKLECERRVRAAFPDACIVRLGWQMALRRGGNQMVEHLHQWQVEQGFVAASAHWFQACSFLEDTGGVLADLLEGSESGIFHLDGNPGWEFSRIATVINRALGCGWDVRTAEDPRLNNMLRDPRLPCVSIARRLKDIVSAPA